MQVRVRAEFEREPARLVRRTRPGTCGSLETTPDRRGGRPHLEGKRVRTSPDTSTGQRGKDFVFTIKRGESEEAARSHLRPVADFGRQRGRPHFHLVGDGGERGRLTLYGFHEPYPH